MARVMLQCRQQSHPFNDRDVVTNEPIKIGRAVANCKPGTDNCFFNCKVLSRNHAVLWYENGKFFLQDTQSSNGTFVNNQKLPPGSAPTSPGSQGTLKTDSTLDGRKEVTSGDLVQFGVEVVEQPKKGVAPTTHGCIIANLKLFHPDGSEAKPPPGKAAAPQTAAVDGVPNREEKIEGPKLSMLELYELQTVLQEAHHREHVLESKLASLNKILLAIERRDTWTATFQEDLLLSRIQSLQGQVNSYESQLRMRPNSSASRSAETKAHSEPTTNTDNPVSPSINGGPDSQFAAGGDDHNTFLAKARDAEFISDDHKLSLLADWKNLIEERAHFESVARDSLQRALSEKSELGEALAAADERLCMAQTECGDLKSLCQHTQKELLELVEKFQRQSSELDSMGKMYQESERVKLECLDTLNAEKSVLEEQLHFYKEKCDYNLNMYDELAKHNLELQEQNEQLRMQKSSKQPENMSAGELIWTNGLSAESNEDEEETDRRRDIELGDNLTEQSLPENIFQGKNVAQLVQEFGNASDDDERRSGQGSTGDGPLFLKNEDVIQRFPRPDESLEPEEEKLVRKKDGGADRRTEENFNQATVDIAELLSAKDRLTEIVMKLQEDLEKERTEKASVASSSPETVETGTSPDEQFESQLSFVPTSTATEVNPPVSNSETVEESENPYARMELTALLDELDTTVRESESSSVPSPRVHWAVLYADPTAAVALLLLLVWLAFSLVFAE